MKKLGGQDQDRASRSKQEEAKDALLVGHLHNHWSKFTYILQRSQVRTPPACIRQDLPFPFRSQASCSPHPPPLTIISWLGLGRKPHRVRIDAEKQHTSSLSLTRMVMCPPLASPLQPSKTHKFHPSMIRVSTSRRSFTLLVSHSSPRCAYARHPSRPTL